MAGQDEQLRLAAQVIDKFSGPIKDMQRSLRSLSAETSTAHKAGTAQAKTHSLALGELKKSVGEVGERINSGLRPALLGLGVGSLSAAAGLTALGAAIKEFSTAARDLSFLQRQTGLAINSLRGLQAIAPHIGSSVEEMSAGLGTFAEHMERINRAPWREFQDTWMKFARTPWGGANQQVIGLFKSLQHLPREQQLAHVLSFIEKIRDQGQKREFLQALGLPAAFANLSRDELEKALAEARQYLGGLSTEAVERGKKAEAAFWHLGLAISRLKEEIGAGLAEPMAKAAESMAAFVREHSGDLVEAIKKIGETAKDTATFIGMIDTAIKQLNDSEPVDLTNLINFSGLDKTWEVFAATWKARWAALKAWANLGTQQAADAAEAERHRLLQQDFPEEAQKEDQRNLRPQPLPFSAAPVTPPNFSTQDIHKYLYGRAASEPGAPSAAPPASPEAEPGYLPPEFFRQMRYVPQTEEGGPRLIKAAWSPDSAEGTRPLKASWTQTGGPSLAAGVSAERTIEGAIERGSHKGVYDALWDFVHDQSAEGGGSSGGGAGAISRASLTPSGAGAGRGGEGVGPGGAFRRGGAAPPMGNAAPESGAAPPSGENSEHLGSGQPGQKTGWWTSDRQRQAVDYLRKNAGLTEMGARGLVSRWANVEASGGPSEVNRSSGAAGIAQWLGSRRQGFKLGDFDSQLAHAAHELNTSEKAAGDVLRRAQSPMEAATGASMYERAEGYNPRTGRDFFTGRTAAGIGKIAGGSSAPPHFTLGDIQGLEKGQQTSSLTPPTGDTTGTGPSADQGGHKYYEHGTVDLGGQKFHWGSGGSGAGALPFGSYPINIGKGDIGPIGRSIGSIATLGGPGGTFTGGGHNWAGVQIHRGFSDALDHLYTQGCFSVAASEWPAFRQRLLEEHAKNPGGLLLNVGRDGMASITSRGQELVPPGARDPEMAQRGAAGQAQRFPAAGDYQNYRRDSLLNAIKSNDAAGHSLREDDTGTRNLFGSRENRELFYGEQDMERRLGNPKRLIPDQPGNLEQPNYPRRQQDASLDLLRDGRRAGFVASPLQHKVTGEASLTVNVNAPRGTTTKAGASGLFKTVQLNRGMSMPLASQDG